MTFVRITLASGVVIVKHVHDSIAARYAALINKRGTFLNEPAHATLDPKG